MTGSATIAYEFDEELGIWAAYIPHVGAYGEGKTKDEALKDLKKAVVLYIETAGEQVFLEQISPKTEYETVSLSTFA